MQFKNEKRVCQIAEKFTKDKIVVMCVLHETCATSTGKSKSAMSVLAINSQGILKVPFRLANPMLVTKLDVSVPIDHVEGVTKTGFATSEEYKRLEPAVETFIQNHTKIHQNRLLE